MTVFDTMYLLDSDSRKETQYQVSLWHCHWHPLLVLRFQLTFKRTNTLQQSQLRPFHCDSRVVLLQLCRHPTGDLAQRKKKRKRESRMELSLHLSKVILEKCSLIEPYMAPVASLWFMDAAAESWINHNVTHRGKKCCTCIGLLNINFFVQMRLY